MAKVYIGVGHGGSDPGAVANGYREKDLNLSISLACRDELERHGVAVKISRTTDMDKPLEERIPECNAYNPDLALDIHNNAGGGDGAEVYHHYAGGTGKTLAENILTEITKVGQNSRGTKIKLNDSGTDYFGFIRQTVAPAVIVECAFVDNLKDVEIISNSGGQQRMGAAIAKGILATLGISTSDNTTQEKSIEDLAKEVIAGKWGNGAERKSRLTAAGYDYAAIQAKVNELLSGGSTGPSVEELAREVIAGKWGNGAERKSRLTSAGYDYDAIQAKVNELLK